MAFDWHNDDKGFSFTCVRPLNEEAELWQFALFNSLTDVFTLWTQFIWTCLHQRDLKPDYILLVKQEVFSHLVFHKLAWSSSYYFCDLTNICPFFPPVSLLMISLGGFGLHVQSHRGNRSSDDAQGLRYSRMGGQLSSHHLFRIHEVPRRSSYLKIQPPPSNPRWP